MSFFGSGEKNGKKNSSGVVCSYINFTTFPKFDERGTGIQR